MNGSGALGAYVVGVQGWDAGGRVWAGAGTGPAAWPAAKTLGARGSLTASRGRRERPTPVHPSANDLYPGRFVGAVPDPAAPTNAFLGAVPDPTAPKNSFYF